MNFVQDLVLISPESAERLQFAQLRSLCRLLCFDIQYGGRKELLAMIKYVSADNTADYEPEDSDEEEEDEDDDGDVDEEDLVK